MKKKIINGFLMVALIAATSTSFVSCKDNDEDVKYDLLNELRGDITPVQTAITNAQTDATQALQDAAAAATAAANAQTAANNAQTTADDAKTKAQQALDWINAQDLSVYMKKADFKDSIANYLKDWALESEVASRFSAVWDELQKQEAKIKADSIKIDSLAGVTTSIKNDVELIKSDITTIKKDVAKAQEDISNIIKTLENLITSVTVNATSNTLLANSKIFPGLNVQFVGAAFGQAVTSSGEFPSTEADLNGNKLNADYINITEGEKYEWDNNIINNKENNAGKIYFTVNPSNVTENILSKNVVFSLTNSQNNKDNNGEPIVTLANVKKSNKILTWGTTRADSEVTLFEADATYDMTKAKAIDPKEVIDFGSIATSFKNIVNSVRDVNRNNVKSTSKSVLKETAQVVANLVNAKIPSLPALALKAEWKDTVGTRNVISDYSLAATAYKPLSFNFGKVNGEVVSPISLDRIDNGFKKILDEVRNELNGIDLSGLKIGTITIDDYSNYDKTKYIWIKMVSDVAIALVANNLEQAMTNVNIEIATTDTDVAPAGFTEGWWPTSNEDGGVATFNGHAWAYNSTTGNYYAKMTKISGPTKIDADMRAAIQTLVEDKVNGTLTKTNDAIQDVIDQVKDVIKKANDALDKAESLENRVTDYLQDYINYAINFVNNGGIARALEPVLLVNSNNGIKRATGTYDAGEYTFVPTTITYELVAPAFKKYIAIVDKTGKARFGKVLTKGDNDFSAVKLTLQQDDVKLIYAAMDFTGRQIIKEYDITVK